MPKAAATSAPVPCLTPKAVRRAATRRLFLRLCGTALGAGVALPVEARLIEPYALEVTRHEVFLPDLPAHLEGTTVAHLTDLHRGPMTPDAVIESAVRLTVALNPDLVVLSGDFVASQPADATHLAGMLEPLRPRLGVWGCLGNHDYHAGPDAVADALTQASKGRIRLLRNEAHALAPGLWVAGIEDTVMGKPDAPRAMQPIPSEAAALFLTHNPVGVWKMTNRPWLALAGHTHGGQILVPGLPPPMPPGMEGFPLVSGWGLFDKARLYVSRGVGMVMAPMRFRCRPEVALHILRRGNQPPRTIPHLPERALRRAARMARSAAHHLT